MLLQGLLWLQHLSLNIKLVGIISILSWLTYCLMYSQKLDRVCNILCIFSSPPAPRYFSFYYSSWGVQSLATADILSMQVFKWCSDTLLCSYLQVQGGSRTINRLVSLFSMAAMLLHPSLNPVSYKWTTVCNVPCTNCRHIKAGLSRENTTAVW